MATQSDKRKTLRVSVARAVIIKLSSGKKVHATLADISETGFGVLTFVPAQVGVTLEFRFSLPIDSKNREFVVNGKIIFCHLRGDKYINGVQFSDLQKDDFDQIKQFILEVRSKRI